jgi:hypothetical protein
MTRTCFPHSYAKYSAVVRAIQGVIIGSIVGSFACKDKGARYLAQLSYYHLTHLIDKVNKIYQIPGSEKELTRSIEPFSIKVAFQELGCFHIYSHSSNDNGKVVIFATQRVQKQKQVMR